jgi:hypothetical protein
MQETTRNKENEKPLKSASTHFVYMSKTRMSSNYSQLSLIYSTHICSSDLNNNSLRIYFKLDLNFNTILIDFFSQLTEMNLSTQ